MNRLARLPLLICLGAVLTIAACGDDDGAQASPTAPTATATATATPGSQPPVATASQAASPTGAAATATRAVPADGTVDPLGGADTTAVTTKPDTEVQRPQPLLKDVRIGVHPELGGWDRIVFEFQGGLPGARIEYISQAAQCGSGQKADVPGSAILSVRFESAAAHDEQGNATFGSESITAAGETILGARQTCDFEGVVSWATGIKGKQAFKVTTLSNPPRLVIDIRH